MNKKELQAFAQTAAKNIKSQEDLNQFQQMLTKVTVEAALNAELDTPRYRAESRLRRHFRQWLAHCSRGHFYVEFIGQSRSDIVRRNGATDSL